MDKINSFPVIPAITSLEEAKAFLNTCTREELRDHAFGDTEVGWMINGREVASGYFGSTSKIISIISETGKSVWCCKGTDAQELRNTGTLGKVERNDETGPDQYQEGYTMPGLTLEGVRAELTKG